MTRFDYFEPLTRKTIMTPSKYQTAIYEAAESSTENLVVNAVAGSGKTTTIKQTAKKLKGNGVFVAFNKHIAEALQTDLPYNIKACTMNSFGWRVCLSEISGISRQVDAQKTEKVLKTFFDMDSGKERKKYYSIVGATKRAVSLLKANCHSEGTPQNISALLEDQGMEAPTPEDLDIMSKTYAKCLSMKTVCDFDDQVFYPWYFDLNIPQVDFAIADEVQDFNPIQRLLFLGMGKRLMGVGDERQAIYGFRGADPESIQNLCREISGRLLPLSICYRCGKNIVKQAQSIVPEIEYWDQAPDGIVDSKKTDVFQKEVTEGDYALCRTTAPLVSECLRLIRDGRKATVKGRDIGAQITALIDKLSFENDRMIINDFIQRLDKYRIEQTQRLEAAERDAEVIVLNDKVDTIYAILESCDNVGAVKSKISQIFSDDTRSGIIFCTVHKSKGLEAPKIYILEPQLMPHPSAKKEWQQKQEANLKYVAITRAMNELYWVTK